MIVSGVNAGSLSSSVALNNFEGSKVDDNQTLKTNLEILELN